MIPTLRQLACKQQALDRRHLLRRASGQFARPLFGWVIGTRRAEIACVGFQNSGISSFLEAFKCLFGTHERTECPDNGSSQRFDRIALSRRMSRVCVDLEVLVGDATVVRDP